jgi:hypothetical protein
MTFKERDGLPELFYLTRFLKEEGKIISIILHKNTYKYKIFNREFAFSNQNDISKIFHYLIEQHKNNNTDFKSYRTPLPIRTALFPVIALLESEDIKKRTMPKDITFEIPLFIEKMSWLGPIRSKPKRTYDGYGLPYNPEGEHTPYIIKSQLSKRSKTKTFAKTLEIFGAESGLFKEVRIRKLGREANAAFELIIVLNTEPLSINSVGYGISQSLPIIVDFIVRRENSWFAVQQPEIHLHPRAQAALGDVIYQFMKNESKNFLIETHSDFTIDRFRMNFRKNKLKISNAQILFFEREGDGNKVTPIEILSSGEYSPDQPKSFREFFLKEQIKMLDL